MYFCQNQVITAPIKTRIQKKSNGSDTEDPINHEIGDLTIRSTIKYSICVHLILNIIVNIKFLKPISILL